MSEGEQEGSNMAEENVSIIQSADGLVADVRSMIEQTRKGVAHAVSAGMALLYWRIGKRIQTEVLEGRRADYGKKIVSTLSRQLVKEFGIGFSEKSLRRMVQFAEVFPDSEIVVSLVRQLSWTHTLALLPLKGPLRRESTLKCAVAPYSAGENGSIWPYSWLGGENHAGNIRC